jgi:hypothetical protein
MTALLAKRLPAELENNAFEVSSEYGIGHMAGAGADVKLVTGNRNHPLLQSKTCGSGTQ